MEGLGLYSSCYMYTYPKMRPVNTWDLWPYVYQLRGWRTGHLQTVHDICLVCLRVTLKPFSWWYCCWFGSQIFWLLERKKALKHGGDKRRDISDRLRGWSKKVLYRNTKQFITLTLLITHQQKLSLFWVIVFQ